MSAVTLALSFIACSLVGSPDEVQSTQVISYNTLAPVDAKVVVGSMFLVKVTDGATAPYVMSWRSLTPHLGSVDLKSGVFRATEVGYGVLQAEIYRGSRETKPARPDTEIVTIPIEIKPIAQLSWRALPTFMEVGTQTTAEIAAHRRSTSQNSAIRLKREAALRALGEYETLLMKGNEGAEPPSAQIKEADALLADISLKVVSLTPDVLLVSQPSLPRQEQVVIGNAQPVELHALSAGKATIRVTGGGLQKDYSFPVYDPIIVFSTEGKAKTDKEVKVKVQYVDKDTKKPIKGVATEVSIKGPDKVEFYYVRSDDATTVTFTPKKPGDYEVSARALRTSVPRTSTIKLFVRSQVKRLKLASSVVEIVEGDHGRLKLEPVDTDDKPITLTAEDYGSSTSGAKFEAVKEQPTLRFDPPQGPGIYKVEVKVDDCNTPLIFKVRPALEIVSSQVSTKMARDLFGGQVAREFVIRELVFRNRLNEVVNNELLRDKEMIVYGHTLSANVLVGRTTGKVEGAALMEALENADYLLQFTSEDELWSRFRGYEASVRERTKAVDFETWKLYESERRQAAHRRSIEEFLFSREAADPKASVKVRGRGDYVPVVVMPYNPVFASEISMIKDSIEARSPLNKLEDLFKNIVFFTTFASQVKGSPQDLLGRLVSATDRNPFNGPVALENKPLVETLVRNYLDHRRSIDAKSGKGLAAGSELILDGTLSLGAGSTARRYLLIPRDSISTGRGRILEIIDNQIRVSYNVVTSIPTDAKAKAGAPATSTGSGPGGK